MREIKFRAWNKEDESIYQVAGLQLIRYRPMVSLCSDVPGNYWRVPLSKLILMQYTGLKDKDGKEGYFDDIVQWGKSIYQVIWNEIEGVTQLVKISGPDAFNILPIKAITNGKIIDNIWLREEK